MTKKLNMKKPTIKLTIKQALAQTTISQHKIISVWNEVQIELSKNYPAVKSFKMPQINAWVYPSKQYLLITKYRRQSGIQIAAVEEYGMEIPNNLLKEECASLSGGNNYYSITVRKGYGGSVKHHLTHEIKHIYEQMLGLSIGTLTNNSMTPRQNNAKSKP
jgi:hypothetical protein